MNVSDKKGLSLIELVFVVALLAIIALLGVLAYPKILHNMQVRTDRISANQICRSLRIWYEYNVFNNPKSTEFIEFINDELYEKTVALKSLENKGLSMYVDLNYKPESFKDSYGALVEEQAFFVGVIAYGNELKFVITVETPDDRLEEINATSQVDYDGKSIGVIYIER